jgi:methylmalonyl-CoA/ethylmalonyl-CoA epimerase
MISALQEAAESFPKPEQFGLRFHHIGLAVKDASLARKFLAGLGYRQGRQVFDPLRNVSLTMYHHDVMPDVEIVYPAVDGSGPIDTLLARRPEGIVYHLCYASRDVADSVARIENSGLRPLEIAPAEPAVLFDGKPVSFYMIKGVGLIEILAE